MLARCGKTCRDFQMRRKRANTLQWQEGLTRTPTRHQKTPFTTKLTSKLVRRAKANSKRSIKENSRKSRKNTCAVLNLAGSKQIPFHKRRCQVKKPFYLFSIRTANSLNNDGRCYPLREPDIHRLPKVTLLTQPKFLVR